MGEEKKEQGNEKTKFPLGLPEKLPPWVPAAYRGPIAILICLVSFLGTAVLFTVAIGNAAPGFSNIIQQFRPTPTPTPTPITCSVSGHVYDTDNNNLPMISTNVGYYTKDAYFKPLTTTDANGYYELDCTLINDAQFPIKLVVEITKHSTIVDQIWKQNYETDIKIYRGQKQSNVNIYVPSNDVIPSC